MSLQLKTSKPSEAGFTLVELAIVMVIIGLLIAGLLKGQELIANARVTSTVAQLKSTDAALNAFQDKFDAIAGDMANANTRLPGAVAAESGDGDGALDNVAGAAPTATTEGVLSFVQLARANLVTGVVPGGTATFGNLMPTVPAGGGMWLGTSSATGTATGFAGTTLASSRTYAALNGTPVAWSATTGAISVAQTAQIDRKLDDGRPAVGNIQSLCGAGGITAGVYTEAASTTCGLYVRVLN